MEEIKKKTVFLNGYVSLFIKFYLFCKLKSTWQVPERRYKPKPIIWVDDIVPYMLEFQFEAPKLEKDINFCYTI